MPARRRVTSVRDLIDSVASEFRELDAEVPSRDALRWHGYGLQIKRARERSGELESVVTGHGLIAQVAAVLIVFDFNFLGGSMGEATGERIVRALRTARAEGLPVVSLIASGGARVQEGMRSLVQMQRIAAEIAANRREGIFQLALLRNPTTGGVWASLAAAADVIVALEGATVAFAGSRLRCETDDNEAFTATGKRAAGFVDVITDSLAVPRLIAGYLELLHKRVAPSPCPPPIALAADPELGTAWSTVLAARDPTRPRAEAYLDAYFERRSTLSGDRCGGVDDGMLCGIGRRGDHAIAFVAQTGVANTPAGFRTAQRVFALAERLRLPILTIIDTAGAANDASAERQGVGTAIAELLVSVASLTVPITSLVIGEGGSGGALALAAHDNLWTVPGSYFSVIAPEGAAAILLRDSGRAQELAARMQMTPPDLERLGITRGSVRPGKI